MRPLKRFLKTLVEKLKHIKETKFRKYVFDSINIYFEDESRLGLLTRQKRVLTRRGIKPIAPYQHKFDNLYLFGAFSPINGDSFLLEMPHCNTDNFQIYLDEFSLQKPKEFKIIVLDNGAFHHARRLNIPNNIALIFLPPYSPELNPAEQMWRLIKDKMSMRIYPTLEHLSNHLQEVIRNLVNVDTVKSVCGYSFYKDNFNAYF